MDPRVVIADLRNMMAAQAEQLDRIEKKLDTLLSPAKAGGTPTKPTVEGYIPPTSLTREELLEVKEQLDAMQSALATKAMAPVSSKSTPPKKK